MKSFIIMMVLVLLVILCAFTGDTEARKKPKVKPGVCKYERKGEEGPCVSNNKNITLPLKKGDPTTCDSAKIVSKPCADNSLTKKKRNKIKGCKYERKGSEWTDCDEISNEKTKVLKLKDGSSPQCATTRTKTRSCGGRKKGNRKSRKDA